MNPSGKNGRRPPARSRGAALLLLLFMVVAVFSTTLVTSLADNTSKLQRQQSTLDALARARQALIAWSVVQGDVGTDTYHRPGTLPCPDTNFFGAVDSGNAAGACSAAGGTSIGRLPWKSLGVDRLRDAQGETLWYAISDKFRNPSLNSAAINSDTQGSLQLYAADGSTLTSAGEELAAVIFAPGPPLPGQDRVTSPNTASSYLDAFGGGKNNANAAGPFIMGPAKDAGGNVLVNDLVIGITARELIAAVEQRALNEAQNALQMYFDTTGRYPNPAPPGAAGCMAIATNVAAAPDPVCASDGATCFGRLPEDVLQPYAAAWFSQNAWGRVMTYAIHDAAAGCPAALNIGGQTKSYVLIAPGTAHNGQNRPSASLADYLEASDGGNAWPANPFFSVPGGNSNDQLRSFP